MTRHRPPLGKFWATLGFGAIDQVGLRFLDLFSLWIVLHTLPAPDLANYGVVTGTLGLFNAFLLIPEIALLRERKHWIRDGVLTDHLKAFLLFAELRVLLLLGMVLLAAAVRGTDSVFFQACAFALIVQTIQLAELARIDQRAGLRQRAILITDLPLKLLLVVACSVLFLAPSLNNYLAIYLSWAVLSDVVWLWHLWHHYRVRLHFDWRQVSLIRQVLTDFSLWNHLSWLVMSIVFVIDPWVLTWFGTDTHVVATYTVALKVASMFLLLPTYLQIMAGILLLNADEEEDRRRIKRLMFGVTASIALLQFLTFALAGERIGRLMRGEGLDMALFMEVGLILNAGGLALNLVRPWLAELILHGSLRTLALTIHLPVLLFGLCSYYLLTDWFGATGCAMAAALSYVLCALLTLHLALRGKRSATPAPGPALHPPDAIPCRAAPGGTWLPRCTPQAPGTSRMRH